MRREALEAEERELLRLRSQREAEEKLWHDQQQQQQQQQAAMDAELATRKAEEERDAAARADQLARDQQVGQNGMKQTTSAITTGMVDPSLRTRAIYIWRNA